MNAISIKRNPAKRVFAAELRDIRKTFKSGNDVKSPSFALLPTGERANRVLVCGILMNRTNSDKGTWVRANVMDITGTFSVSASGDFQPETKRQLTRIDITKLTYVAIVGAPKLFRPSEDATPTVSVDARQIYTITNAVYSQWVQDAAQATIDRVKVLTSDAETEDIVSARDIYGDIKPVEWVEVARNALAQLSQIPVPTAQTTLL